MALLGWQTLGTSFDCACGVTHSLPIETCYVGSDAKRSLSDCVERRGAKSCFVVMDANTRAAGGETLLGELGRRGARLADKTYGSEPFEATKERVDELVVLARGADLVVGAGAGTVSDLAKYTGHTLGAPVLLYPTAASMNGYTSSIAALKVNGLKRTLPCQPALGVFADPAVVATAPVKMTAAGLADFLSKSSSSTDWRAAHLLRGDYFCERPREFFVDIQEQVLKAAPGVKTGELAAVDTVLEGLLLSGFSMVIAGSSAPASGGEHLISHYLDMKDALYGTGKDLHGAQVGVATVHCLRLWERILAVDVASLDIDALASRAPAPEAVEAAIREDWGDTAEEVLAQWRQKALAPEALRAELSRFKETTTQLTESLCADLLPARTVEQAIAAAGGATSAKGLSCPREEFDKAVRRARYLRNRFTVLDLAVELEIAEAL